MYSSRIVSYQFETIVTSLDTFVESHQFVSEILEIQVKFQHDCRIVSICIRGSSLIVELEFIREK